MGPPWGCGFRGGDRPPARRTAPDARVTTRPRVVTSPRPGAAGVRARRTAACRRPCHHCRPWLATPEICRWRCSTPASAASPCCTSASCRSRRRTSCTSGTPRASPTATARRTSCWPSRASSPGSWSERGAKLLVVACNSATAAALPTLREELGGRIPVVGVVAPGGPPRRARHPQRAGRPDRHAGHGGERRLRAGAGGGRPGGRAARGGHRRARAADPGGRRRGPPGARLRGERLQAAQRGRAWTPSSSAAPTTR